MTDLVRRKQQGEAWETIPDPDAGGGSSQSQSATVTATKVDSNTDFDLGALATASIVVIATGFDGDGETFGGGDGEIGVEASMQISADGVTWGSPAGSNVARKGDPVNNLSVTPGDGLAAWIATQRYVRVHLAMLVSPDEDPYVGANDPTATLDITINYFA